MAKQTRRSVSITGELYEKLRQHCDHWHISASGLAEHLLREQLGMDQKPDKRIESYLRDKGAEWDRPGSSGDDRAGFWSNVSELSAKREDIPEERRALGALRAHGVVSDESACADMELEVLKKREGGDQIHFTVKGIPHPADIEGLEKLREDQEPKREQPYAPPPFHEIPSAEVDPIKGMSDAERREYEKRQQIARKHFTF